MSRAAVKIRGVAGVLILAVLLVGCSSQVRTHGPGKNRIRGKVTVNGEPIKKGTINLLATNDGIAVSGGPGGGAAIDNGVFTIEDMPPGKFLIGIYALVDNFEPPTNVVEVVDGPNPDLILDLPLRKQMRR